MLLGGLVWQDSMFLCKKPRVDFMRINVTDLKQSLMEIVLIYESSVSPNLYNKKHKIGRIPVSVCRLKGLFSSTVM